jgi:hypothetical protein
MSKISIIGTAEYNGRNYNLVYEDNQRLIWLDYTDRNTGGWDNAIKWAAGLNASGVLSFSFKPGISVTWEGDWRLPKTIDGKRKFGYDGSTTAGFNITSGEMGNLYYKSLGNSAYFDAGGKSRSGWGKDASWGLKNKAPFINLYPENYWSCTDYSIYNQHAWFFDLGSGSQTNGSVKTTNCYNALAVRPVKITQASS